MPADPRWKREYAATIQRLIRDGVDAPLADLFSSAVGTVQPESEGVGRAAEEDVDRRAEAVLPLAPRRDGACVADRQMMVGRCDINATLVQGLVIGGEFCRQRTGTTEQLVEQGAGVAR